MERFRSLERIFSEALEQPAGDRRDTLVNRLCGSDHELRTEVTLLLENHERIRAESPAAESRLPRFGVWQAIREVGRGGMGTVYLAERADGEFRMTAAVKVVPLALASPEIEERFRRERQFLASLQHPRIARLIDGGVSGLGLPYLVMEFVAGLNIEAFCEVRRLDPRSRIALVRQVLDALTYVHARHAIHRDVKPSNILVNESGEVKLLDFGTARLMDATADSAITRFGVFAFTPEYASPEQARGETVTAASDLYAAGILLYRLLTGRMPYRITDRSPSGVAAAIARSQPDMSGLDAPLAAIVAKALRKNASTRYQTASEMDADLGKYLSGRRVRVSRPVRKGWAAAAVVLLALIAGWLGFRALRLPPVGRALIPFQVGVPNPMQPALSRDGKWLAFASRPTPDTRSAIWLEPVPGGSPRRITGPDIAGDEPSLSPDGRWLAFHSSRQPAGIYIVSTLPGEANQPPRLLVEGGRSPKFSPDGKKVAFLNASASGGDPEASNTRMLYIVPAMGGNRLRLARNASSVQGFAWTAGGSSILYIATDEQTTPRLWLAPLDGGPASVIAEFAGPVQGAAQVCGATARRLFYTAMTPDQRVLAALRLDPAGQLQYAALPGDGTVDVVSCTVSADSLVLADAEERKSNLWQLPIDADRAIVKGTLQSITALLPGDSLGLTSADGRMTLTRTSQDPGTLYDARTGIRRHLPIGASLASDGIFALQPTGRRSIRGTATEEVLNLETGQTWGRIDTHGTPWDLAPGGQWMLAASPAAHRSIVVWDTHSLEHLDIYSHPMANLYLASFSPDLRWVLFTSEERGEPPHIWAAPFRGLQNIPVAEWIDLGQGDYPRWAPAAARIYFTQRHDGFQCVYTRALDPATKRPTGPSAVVQHLHGPLTPQGIRSGSFRLSVARDRIILPLGQRTHQIYQWK